MNLNQEVKNDPLTTLNMILTFFTVVSFGRLCSELFTSFCCKNKDNNKIDQILYQVKNLPNNTDRLETLEFTLDQLQATVERMNSYITQIHFQVCANPQQETDAQSQSGQSEQSQSQSQQSQESTQSQSQAQDQDQEQELQVQALQPVETIKTPKDKHAQLINALKNGDTVSLKYKKQTFDATFLIQPTAQHGYLLKCGSTEYNTPSHFSYAKKLTLNDKLHSDNGWDTVYVTRDKKKVSLNALLQEQ